MIMVTLLLQTSLLLEICAWFGFATLVAATTTGPALVHEARQGPIFSDSLDPTSSTSSTNDDSTTMSPTSTSELSSTLTSSISPMTTPTPSKFLVLPPSSSLVNPASPSSSVTSSATPQPSPSSTAGSLTFVVNNMTTCTSGLISWDYTGRTADLILSLTNVVVDQNDVSLHVKQHALRSTGQQLVDTNTSASSWAWPTVNVTEGWYQIQGQVLTTPTVSNSSTPFFVSNGTNVSCLTATLSQTSTASSSSSGSKLNVGGLVGGVVAGVLGVALVVLAGVWFWTRRRKGSSVGGSRGPNRQWGSLKSNPSTIQPEGGGVRVTRDVFHSHPESTGVMFQVASDGTASALTTPGGSEEDVDTVGEEKFISPASSACTSPADVLNTPIRYNRRTSLQSVQTPTTAVSESSSRSRAFSQHTSNHTLEQQAQRIRSSMETSFRRRSERLSLPSLPSPSISLLPYSHTPRQYNREEYPLSPVPPAPINRSISTGAVTTSMPARRASRKPVPHYDPSVLLEDTNADSASTFTACAESSYSHGTGKGTGVDGAPQDLVHKASFGDGRLMHYLIPDLPPPQQDLD